MNKNLLEVVANQDSNKSLPDIANQDIDIQWLIDSDYVSCCNPDMTVGSYFENLGLEHHIDLSGISHIGVYLSQGILTMIPLNNDFTELENIPIIANKGQDLANPAGQAILKVKDLEEAASLSEDGLVRFNLKELYESKDRLRKARTLLREGLKENCIDLFIFTSFGSLCGSMLSCMAMTELGSASLLMFPICFSFGAVPACMLIDNRHEVTMPLSVSDVLKGNDHGDGKVIMPFGTVHRTAPRILSGINCCAFLSQSKMLHDLDKDCDFKLPKSYDAPEAQKIFR